MFDRVIKFVGQDNFNKLKDVTVMVIGLGGVGGYAVEGLIRSGIYSIIIVDYDIVDISNLNRQLITNQSNIGKFKTDVMEEHILSINPKCNIIKINKKLMESDVEVLFSNSPDYVIDACDTIVVKQELIRLCLERKIPIISSMGTGNKIDPSKLEVVDISKTSYDPLAKRIRKYLKDNHILGKVPVVYSKEQNEKFIGSIPSMIFVPATSGLLCANYVIKKVLEKGKKDL